MPSAPFVINSELPGDWRRRRAEEFQERPGFDVMLLSRCAGRVGLTLTAANHVIHLTRWWNPAVEDQCTARVNRLLDALLARKHAQSEDTLAPAEASGDELNSLFSGATGVGQVWTTAELGTPGDLLGLGSSLAYASSQQVSSDLLHLIAFAARSVAVMNRAVPQ